MKWVYIAIGLLVTILIINIVQNKHTIYTNKGNIVVPIHVGVEHEK